MNRFERHLTEGLTLSDLPTCGNSDESGWLLWFGEGHGRPYYVLVGERHLEDALDEAVDHLSEHAPGLLADEQVKEEYDRLVKEGMSKEKAQEDAEADTTYAGDCGHYVMSYEWGYSAEPISRPSSDWITTTPITYFWKTQKPNSLAIWEKKKRAQENAEKCDRAAQHRRIVILHNRLAASWDRRTFEKRAEAAGWRV